MKFQLPSMSRSGGKVGGSGRVRVGGLPLYVYV